MAVESNDPSLEDWRTLHAGEDPNVVWACPPFFVLQPLVSAALRSALLEQLSDVDELVFDATEQFGFDSTHSESGGEYDIPVVVHVALTLGDRRIPGVVTAEVGTLISRFGPSPGVFQLGFRFKPVVVKERKHG